MCLLIDFGYYETYKRGTSEWLYWLRMADMHFNKIRFNVCYAIMKRLILLEILNDLSIKHLIKLILFENNVKLLKFKRSPV